MFYQPELMIYLWLLPVLGMVVLPVLGALTCKMYQAAERSRLSDVRGFLDLNMINSPDVENQERRTYPRICIEAPKANVARQAKCCRTFITNISQKGLCINNVPRKMYEETGDTFKVVFRSPGRNYTMHVKPIWKKQYTKGYMIGAELISVPSSWESFILELCNPKHAQAA